MMNTIQLYDCEPNVTDALHEIVSGLKQTPKHLPIKFSYDERGAKLYEELCQTTDYYLTRTELSIMHQYVQQIADCFDDQVLIIEYGSGNAQKTQFLFDHLPNVIGYIPIDISKQQLIEISTEIAAKYPHIEILPVCADYTQFVELPRPSKPFSRRLVYYPGSTIGNIHPHEVILFLKQIRSNCQPGDALLIGVDLKKDPAILLQAYDDRNGILKQFNCSNPLEQLNCNSGTDFVISQYQHYVLYNALNSCVEVYIKSLCQQTVQVNGEVIEFAAGELVERAVAYKYDLDSFQKLVAQAGWQTKQVWTDDKQWFSVQYLTAA